MEYKLKDYAVIPYRLLKDIRGQLPAILGQELTNENLFYMVGSNLGLVRALIQANFENLTPEDMDNLDILDDILPMCKALFEKVKEDLQKPQEKYILHEYDENFTGIAGSHVTARYKVSLGVVEDVISAILGIQETKTLDAEAITKILEDVEDAILRSFPTLDCVRLDYTNAIEIIKMYKKYFDLGIQLLSGKNGASPKANQKTSK